MPENQRTQQQNEERSRILTEATNKLETSMRDFLVAAYLQAIPCKKFCGFWCALGTIGEKRPLVNREHMLPYLGSACSLSKNELERIPDKDFHSMVRQACGDAPSEELRRDVLGCLDIAGFFNLYILDIHYVPLMGGTLYRMLADQYPALGSITPSKWKGMNYKARDHRHNDIGHVNSHTFRKMSLAAWRADANDWVKVADCLHNADNDALYAAIKNAIKYADKSESYTLVPLQELADTCGRFTAEEVAKILQEFDYTPRDGAVFCDKNIALHFLSYAADQLQRTNTEQSLRQDYSQRRAQTPAADSTEVAQDVLDRHLKKVPALHCLPGCTAEPLDGRALTELVQTHYLVLTSSLLKSAEGRQFVTSRLMPALQHVGRDPREALILDSTMMYHLLQEQQEYTRLAETYRRTLWIPQREDERSAMAQRLQELRKADSAYRFFNQTRLPLLGAPDPLADEETSLLGLMESHPFDRFCVLLCGAAGFVRKVDRQHLPFVLVGRVRSGAERPVCTLFPQLMPPARADRDDPLLKELVEEYSASLMVEPAVEADEEPAEETPAPAPVETPAPVVNPAPVEKPAPAPVPKPQPTPRHGTADFAPDLPLRRMDDTRLPCHVRPAAGLVLTTEDGAPVTLGGPLMEDTEEAKGGEGSLFLTDLPGQVAKIYNPEHLTAGRRDKLDAMLRHDPKIRGVCWPTHMLYTRDGEFLGYTMPRAPEGALPFSKSVLRIGSPSVHEQLLPSWDRMDLVQTARSAANLVALLHRHNILMGDVNAGNFMVAPQNSSEVFLVDTDSFQLGGFPCPVGVADFTHPGTAKRLGVAGELKYDTFLRTKDEENYVLAILLFKLLFLNQNPFVTKTSMTYREAMAARKFSYALDGDDYDVPAGDSWMIWKNLPHDVANAFTAAFTKWQCATAEDWVRLLDRYANSIRKFGFSRELAPAKYHEFRPDDPIYVDLVCPCCHKEFNIHKNRYAKLHDEYHTPIFCRSCETSLRLHGTEVLPNSLTCVKCGKPYDATFRDTMFALAEPQRAVCPRCRQRRPYFKR